MGWFDNADCGSRDCSLARMGVQHYRWQCDAPSGPGLGGMLERVAGQWRDARHGDDEDA
jgi:hypothetical protein